MENNPLDTEQITYFFEFEEPGFPSEYRISELPGSDGFNFVNDQEPKRYARSVEYGAVDSLTSVNSFAENVGITQVYNPQGDSSDFLDFGFHWLLYGYKIKGFQFKAFLTIKKSGVVFNRMQCDFSDKDVTDGHTFVKFKLIQRGKVADLKRRLDDKFNMYGQVDAKNNTIAPAPTIDFLRKAVPLPQYSKWSLPQTYNLNLTDPLPGSSDFTAFNYMNKVDESGISNTLSYIQDTKVITGTTPSLAAISDFIYLRALNDLSNGTIQFSNIQMSFTPNASVASYNIRAYYAISKDGTFDYADRVQIYNQNNPTSLNINQTLSNVVIERSNALYFWFESRVSELPGSFIGAQVVASWTSGEIEANFTSTAIDTVIRGIRWMDGIKQASLFASGLPVNAPLFDVNGLHYNNMLFNRRGVSRLADNFTATAKILLESVEEVNCDYEPDENEIFIGHQSDFYENEEIGVFNVIPEESFSIEENDRCQINKFQYKYKTFQQDRAVEGTTNAIHTEKECRILNDNVENVKEVSIDLIRDPFTHQSMVDLEIAQPSTSTSDDDKINIVEITSLAPSSFGKFSARLYMRVLAGKVEILNRNTENPNDTSDVVINWAILGLNVGGGFSILSGDNAGNYTVDTIQPNVLTLTPVGFTPTFTGNSFITVKYFYSGINYVTRTNEGFISNPLSLQNANYSIYRNITRYFGEYLAGCLMYEKKGIINADFKNYDAGFYASQMTNESAPVIENGNIPYSSLPTPLITPKVMNAVCVAEYEQVLAYLNAYKQKRGYARLLFPDGQVYFAFLQKLDQLWLENRLKTIGEQKYQDEFLEITSVGSDVFVKGYATSVSTNANWWRFDNDFIVLYDDQNRPLNNKDDYPFDKVKLNGVIYETKAELITELLSL